MSNEMDLVRRLREYETFLNARIARYENLPRGGSLVGDVVVRTEVDVLKGLRSELYRLFPDIYNVQKSDSEQK